MSAETLLVISIVVLIMIIVRPDVMLQVIGVALLIAVPFGGFLPPQLAGLAGTGSAFTAMLMIGIGRGLHSLRILVRLKRTSDPAAAAAVPVKRWGF